MVDGDRYAHTDNPGDDDGQDSQHQGVHQVYQGDVSVLGTDSSIDGGLLSALGDDSRDGSPDDDDSQPGDDSSDDGDGLSELSRQLVKHQEVDTVLLRYIGFATVASLLLSRGLFGHEPMSLPGSSELQ